MNVIMEDKYKICGWAFSIYGALILVFSAFVYSIISIEIGSLDFIFFIAAFVLGLLTFLCGVLIFKGNKYRHKIALPIAVLSLVNIPLGTLVGGFYLWLRYVKLNN